MAFSYSALKSYGKGSGLGSVEGWNMSHSVVKDPPKSGTCRRIDRVGDTNEVLLQVAEGTDRLNSNIQLYARGVNHAVSVDFGNNGNNGGLGQKTVNRGQSYLPYRIIRDGAFRPPIVPQSQLLPLSRQPREFTQIPSTIHNPDYSVSEAGWNRNGGLSETNMARHSRSIQTGGVDRQPVHSRVQHTTGFTFPQPTPNQLSPYTNNNTTTHQRVTSAPNYIGYNFGHEEAEMAAQSRQGNRLTGTLSTNLSGPVNPHMTFTDYHRLPPRLPMASPFSPTHNVSKPLIH